MQIRNNVLEFPVVRLRTEKEATLLFAGTMFTLWVDQRVENRLIDLLIMFRLVR